jgi:hypothetical protein
MKDTSNPTQVGNPISDMDQSVTDVYDNQTGHDVSDIPTNGIEAMIPEMPNRDQGTTHEGDLGRMSK